MRRHILIGALILTTVLAAPLAALAQIPGGVQVPGIPSLPSKDSLLQQAKDMVADLTSLKSSGKLSPPQMKQVDGMLPKAQSVQSELEKPQIPPNKLTQLASTLSDLQKDLGQLKALAK